MKYFFSLFSSYVIGTVNQSDVTSLNLHKNFKWVLCVNHTEPVKNYLYRYLLRRLVDHEIKYLDLDSNFLNSAKLLNSPPSKIKTSILLGNLSMILGIFL